MVTRVCLAVLLGWCPWRSPSSTSQPASPTRNQMRDPGAQRGAVSPKVSLAEMGPNPSSSLPLRHCLLLRPGVPMVLTGLWATDGQGAVCGPGGQSGEPARQVGHLWIRGHWSQL